MSGGRGPERRSGTAAARAVTIGTRGSALALAQARWVKERLEAADPELRVELRVIKTSGDRFFESPVQSIGGKGLFVKEIEDALREGTIDLAVHSMKDLPTELPPGLIVAAVPEREDPRDVLISGSGLTLRELPAGSRVATSSLRRRAQLLHYRSDLAILPMRGNIDTRLRKLSAGEADALVLAAAGLKRIGAHGRITEFLESEICVGAVAQGALALETRNDDTFGDALASLHHEPTCVAVMAERAFLHRLGGGCHVPVGALARLSDGYVEIIGVAGDADGNALYRGSIRVPVANAVAAGTELAERLLADGAAALFSAVSA